MVVVAAVRGVEVARQAVAEVVVPRAAEAVPPAQAGPSWEAPKARAAPRVPEGGSQGWWAPVPAVAVCQRPQG